MTDKRKSSSEYNKFNETMRKLVSVSHSEIKAKLDAEKAAKPAKLKQKTKGTK